MWAAGLPDHLSKWQAITKDPYILDIVKRGMPIEFVETPSQTSILPTHVSQLEADHIDSQIQKLLAQGVIRKC